MSLHKVLYMEDDAGLARLAQRRLRRAGFDVTIAPDADEGLRMFAEGDYDLVAIDHNMPGKDGLEVIQILSATCTPPPPMVMITGSGNESIAVEALKLGVGDYVVKDVDGGYLDLLPAVLAHVLESDSLAKAKRQAEAALHVSETRYRDLFERMPIGLYSMDMQGTVLTANTALAEILGIDQDTLVGAQMEDFVAGATARKIWPSIIKSPEMRQGMDVRLKRANGTIAWVRATAAVISEENQDKHIEGSIEDVTDRRMASLRIERQTSLLDAINQIFRGTILDDDEESIAQKFVELALQITNSTIACIHLVNGSGFTAYADEKLGTMSTVSFCQQLEGKMNSAEFGDNLSHTTSLDEPVLLQPSAKDEPVVVSQLMTLALLQDGVSLGKMILGSNSQPYSPQDQRDAETLTTAFVEAIIRNRAEEERRKLILDLRAALDRVRTLGGLLPICASCKKIRTDSGYWQEVELYVSENTEAEFTHGLCPECAARYMAELDELERERASHDTDSAQNPT